LDSLPVWPCDEQFSRETVARELLGHGVRPVLKNSLLDFFYQETRPKTGKFWVWLLISPVRFGSNPSVKFSVGWRAWAEQI
jgi:hypothetical protein